jgi:hypothetical protein
MARRDGLMLRSLLKRGSRAKRVAIPVKRYEKALRYGYAGGPPYCKVSSSYAARVVESVKLTSVHTLFLLCDNSMRRSYSDSEISYCLPSCGDCRQLGACDNVCNNWSRSTNASGATADNTRKSSARFWSAAMRQCISAEWE